MNREPLPPIPVPPALRWREFRVRFLPVLLFMLAVGGVALIWERNVSAPMFVGAVEGRSAHVASPYAAKILRLNVDRFQTVTKGTPLAVLEPTDPRIALSVVQSELDILRAKLDPYLTRQRTATDYEQLRMDWLAQRVDLATARANRTGLRRLATQWSASKTHLPSVGLPSVVTSTGMVGVRGVSEASSLRRSARIGSMIGWCEATSTSTRRASLSCASTTAIAASTWSGGPAITVWFGEAYTATVSPS